jgi:hypothetical protein
LYYDGNQAADWAEDNMDDYDAQCVDASCTEFVSTALNQGGLPCTDDWDSSQSCSENAQAWNDASALFDYLTRTLGFQFTSILASDFEEYFKNNPDIPAGTPVFFDTGWVDEKFPSYSFLHVGITTGDISNGTNVSGAYKDFTGLSGPSMADHNGALSSFGPHLMYQTYYEIQRIVLVWIGVPNVQ